MKRTEHYDLPTWEKTDRIMMDDFNDMTQKIDAAIAGRGNCKIVYGTYTGTGTYGKENYVTLTFDGKPLFLAVGGNGPSFAAARDFKMVIMPSRTSSTITMGLKWEENTVSWYNNSASNSLNEEGQTYPYIALISIDPE